MDYLETNDQQRCSSACAGAKYVILMPVFNDWTACQKVIAELDNIFARHDSAIEILIINDASTTPITDSFLKQKCRSLCRVDVLELKRNLGHQRAISIGLAYIEANVHCEAVVIMDSDGEDQPADVPKLLYKYEQEFRAKIVFAQRSRRQNVGLFEYFTLSTRFYIDC